MNTKTTGLLAASATAFAVATGAAIAAEGTVDFVGNVDSTQVSSCTITASQVGALKIGDDFQTLTSKNTTAGRIKVKANAADYKVTVAGPTDGAFKTEPQANKDLNPTQAFAAFYTPDDTSTEVAGSVATTLTANVEFKADVDLEITQDQDYAPGNYAAEVVVTCE